MLIATTKVSLYLYPDIVVMMAQEIRQELKFISLPNTYPSWKDLQQDLESLEKKEIKGLEGLEVILKRHDRWENIHPPFKLLNDVLQKDRHFTTQYFNDILLPWLAKKALQVQELFEAQNFKILVRILVGMQCCIMHTANKLACVRVNTVVNLCS